MKEPGMRLWLVMGSILLSMLLSLWLFSPMPKGRKVHAPSHLGEWESREQIHVSGEGETYFTHLLHALQRDIKYKKGAWPSLQK